MKVKCARKQILSVAMCKTACITLVPRFYCHELRSMSIMRFPETSSSIVAARVERGSFDEDYGVALDGAC